MFCNIVVPIDLSHTERVQDMLRAADSLADKGAKLTVIHVADEVPSFIAAQIPTATIEENLQSARARLKEICETAGVDAELQVRSGTAHHEITSLADEIEADCIVIASHRPALKDYLLGSTAANVVRHAKCTVLVQR
jgi:nucleotide-binding universal stress UspA family protein